MSKRYLNRVKIFEKLRYMLEQMSINIGFRAMTVYELMETICDNKNINGLDFLNKVKSDMELHINFYTAWENAVKDWNVSIKNEDREFVSEIGLSLGKSNIDGELANLEIYKNRLSLILQEAREEAKSKGRMIRSLGILAGAFISVMLI